MKRRNVITSLLAADVTIAGGHMRNSSEIVTWPTHSLRSCMLLAMTGIYAVFLAACVPVASRTAEPVERQVYVEVLSAAVCAAYDQLYAAGDLDDTAKIEHGLEKGVRDFVREQGISEASWLAAKEQYFTPEEHTQLLKMDFTWCITGLNRK